MLVFCVSLVCSAVCRLASFRSNQSDRVVYWHGALCGCTSLLWDKWVDIAFCAPALRPFPPQIIKASVDSFAADELAQVELGKESMGSQLTAAMNDLVEDLNTSYGIKIRHDKFCVPNLEKIAVMQVGIGQSRHCYTVVYNCSKYYSMARAACTSAETSLRLVWCTPSVTHVSARL